jgi:hypothetical protein
MNENVGTAVKPALSKAEGSVRRAQRYLLAMAAPATYDSRFQFFTQ